MNSGSQVTVTLTATRAAITGTTSVAGAVLPGSTPVITPNAVVQPYNPQVGGALAPGTIVAIYGTNLATSAGQPSTTPLPTNFNGTTVYVGGIAAPLFYVGPNQINAQIPFELDPTKQVQVVVSANGALSAPQTIQLTQAAPGLDAFGDGTVVALDLNSGVYVSASSPARPGDFLVLFLLGMGQTDNAVPSGTTTPNSPLAHPTATPTLTLGGVPVSNLQFAGLAPGFVGLYQINLQVPTVPVDGNLVLTVSQNGATSNTTVLPVQR
jgi:uncharacterized protein (TIGR03437 family)